MIGDGRITVPAAIREYFDLSNGDVVEVDVRPVTAVTNGGDEK